MIRLVVSFIHLLFRNILAFNFLDASPGSRGPAARWPSVVFKRFTKPREIVWYTRERMGGGIFSTPSSNALPAHASAGIASDSCLGFPLQLYQWRFRSNIWRNQIWIWPLLARLCLESSSCRKKYSLFDKVKSPCGFHRDLRNAGIEFIRSYVICLMKKNWEGLNIWGGS